jgi:hypothetical protein
MDKLFDILIANPRAALEAGVFIPCALMSALELEDDQAIPRSGDIERSFREAADARPRSAQLPRDH